MTRFKIREMKHWRDLIFVIGGTDCTVAAACCTIPAAHVPTDCDILLRLKRHELLDNERALFSMAAGKHLVDLISLVLFPLAIGVLTIAEALFVQLALA